MCVEAITPPLAYIVEVSQASHLRDGDITPLCVNKMPMEYTTSITKLHLI